MKTFQKPLTAQEEDYYLDLLRSPKEEDVKKAKDVLVERNLRLVAHVAKKYQNADEEMEDLIAIGCIGLMKALQSFDSGKGRLATYACRCIDNEILMVLRSKRKNRNEVSLYEPIGQDRDGNEICLLDVTCGHQPDILERMEKRRNVQKLLQYMEEVLTKREKEILIARYGMFGSPEQTQSMIGSKLGISRSYVSRIEKKALRKLRERFERCE